MMLAIPVGIAAVVLGCQPKNELVQVKGTLDTLKTEWTATDSILMSLSESTKSEVSVFQQNFLLISTNESLATIADLNVKEDVDSIIVVADMETKEAEAASVELETLVSEWKAETDEMNKLFEDVAGNTITADSAEVKVTEFKMYLASTSSKTELLKEVIEDTKKKHESINSEINKILNPSIN